MPDAGADFSSWIGKTRCVESDLSPWPARAVAALLDAPELVDKPGSPLPPLWQWFYFLATARQDELSLDGHPQRGGFMPPIELPRRMFAGARMRFHNPLILGEPASRSDTVKSVQLKSGRSGALAFVTVTHAFHQNEVLCIEEEQDIVYKEPGVPIRAPQATGERPHADDGWQREIVPDPRLLFRFSALTFNAHRIHYDRRYASSEEGYPGLVVHGPLTAVLLADLVRRNDPRPLTAFRFRGRAPILDLAPFYLVGQPKLAEVELEARGPDGQVALEATAEFERTGVEEMEPGVA